MEPTGVNQNGVQDNTPVATKGFGAREQADETRQAQQQVANDSPVDVNPNAIVAREQAGTFTLMGKNFEANADRRNKIFDLLASIHGGNLATAKVG
jgi:hypothetical protein